MKGVDNINQQLKKTGVLPPNVRTSAESNKVSTFEQKKFAYQSDTVLLEQCIDRIIKSPQMCSLKCEYHKMIALGANPKLTKEWFDCEVRRLMKSPDLKPLVDEYLQQNNSNEPTQSSDNMQVFNFSGHDIRVIMQNEDAWFIAIDVCDILGIPTRNIVKTLDADEHKTYKVQCTHQVRHLAIVSEAGLYTLLLRSRKPEAKPFRRWVTHEVLPAINRQGYYSMAQNNSQNNDELAEVVETNQRLEAELDTLKRRYDFIMQFVRTLENPSPIEHKEIPSLPDADNIAVGELARRITQQTGRRINEVNLFKWLRENDYLSDDKRHWNQPTLTAYRQQLFVLEDYPRQLPGGRTMIRHTTRVTGKGQEYFIGIFQRMNSGQKCLSTSI